MTGRLVGWGFRYHRSLLHIGRLLRIGCGGLGTDVKQWNGGPAWANHDFGRSQDGNKPDVFAGGDNVWSLGCICDADRLSDEFNDLWTRWLPVQGFYQDGHSAGSNSSVTRFAPYSVFLAAHSALSHKKAQIGFLFLCLFVTESSTEPNFLPLPSAR